ncbi:MAG: SdrD B-like domain-containing protein [Caldilineaceae bacterium]
MDLAYYNFPNARQVTVPQTMTFAPANVARTGKIIVFASSVEGAVSGQNDRPESIEITVAGVTKTFTNPLNSYDGDEWDTLTLQVDIPAGATSLTIQIFSRDDENTGLRPASMTWIGTGMSIIPLNPIPAIDIEKATNGEDADTPTGPQIVVGDPVNWTYVVTNVGEVTLNDVTVTDNQNVAVSCPQTTLVPTESMTCTASGIAVAGQYANMGTVVGTPINESGIVTDTDPSHYFGLELAAVGDKVFRDANNNGLQDNGEGGVNGIIVELYNSDNTLISTTTTVDGMYLFDNLRPGDYLVKFVNPTGFGVCTTANVGGDDTIDSDGVPVAGDGRGPACQTETFSLEPGQRDLTRSGLGL